MLRIVTAFAFAALTLLLLVAEGAVAQTVNGRFEGGVSIVDGVVNVDGDGVEWADVLYVVFDSGAKALPSPDVVHTVNEDRLACTIRSFENRRVVLDAQILGRRTIVASRVSSLDFLPNLAAPDGRPLRLYRRGGEPIPGMITDFDGRKIDIETQLGKLSFERNRIERYLLRLPSRERHDFDEVVLIDGTVLRGEAEPFGNGLILKHPFLDKLALDVQFVESVVRRPPQGAVYLWEREPNAVDFAGLLTDAAAPGKGLEASKDGYGFYLRPRSRVSYLLPELTGTGNLLAGLSVADGSVGVVRVKIFSGGELLFEEDIRPGDGYVHIEIELNAGGDVVFEVDFGDGFRQPAGVVVERPVVITE